MLAWLLGKQFGVHSGTQKSYKTVGIYHNVLVDAVLNMFFYVSMFGANIVTYIISLLTQYMAHSQLHMGYIRFFFMLSLD